jgi:hypothetical protein
VPPLMAGSQVVGVDGFGRVKNVLLLILMTLDGRAVPLFFHGVLPPFFTAIAPVFLVAIGVLAASSRRAGRSASPPSPDRVPRATTFVAVLFLGIGVQMMITTETDGPHHVIMLWPFHHFLIVGAAASALRSSAGLIGGARPLPRGFATVAYEAVAFLVASQIVGTGVFLANVGEGRRFSFTWDPAIYRLSHKLEALQRETPTVLFTDWGMSTQILALASPEHRSGIRDVWPEFNELHTLSLEARRRYGEQLRGDDVLIVAHSENRTLMPATRRNLFELDRAQTLPLEAVAVINGTDRAPLFEIYRPRAPGR